MMDSSDGLARSLHQLAAASGCGAEVSFADLPVDDAVDAVADDTADRRELAAFFGEDFELVCTIPESDVAAARDACPSDLTVVGEVTGDADATGEEPVTVGGDALPDRGFTHGD
jgi:thiamine-monophosphate kinase